jgi:flagellum-specific ATP synthase
MNEPITDKVRGTLDGHIVLNRKLAQAYHYPAIDVLQSISRLSKRVSGAQTRKAVAKLRTWMATYSTNETMITAGIYEKGTSPEVDEAISKHMEIEEFLKQEEYEPCPMPETLKKLSVITGIEIPEEEFVEAPAVGIPTTAQIVDANTPVVNEN